MNSTPPPIPASFEDFSRRSLELGILSWFCDCQGNILAGPTSASPAAALDRSPLLREHIRKASLQLTEQPATASPLFEIFPGFFLLPQHDLAGTIVSLLLSAEVWNQPQFASIVKQAELDLPRTRAGLATMLPPDRGGAERLAKVLAHYHADLCQSHAQALTLDQFSSRLSQSFEEISAMFNMAHVLNTFDDPAKAVGLACDQLAHLLPFNWMAIWFGDSQWVVPRLAGQLTRRGALPCPEDQFIILARDICSQTQAADWREVLEPGKHPLASLVNSEVLAQPISREGRTVGILLAGGKLGNDPEISSEEIQYLHANANFIGVFHDNMARLAEQRTQFLGTLHALSAAIDAKDRYTCGHSERVALLTFKMATALKLDRATIEQFRIGGMLHDIGKIGVPESALQKCGRLTEAEFAQIKQHPQIGYNILKDIPAMEQFLPGVLHHHERWDGRGYPHRLAGDQIPLIARCLAFADTFDAMSSSRSYRQALPRSHVLTEIKNCAGSQFDPALADLFLAMDFADFDRLLSARIGQIPATTAA